MLRIALEFSDGKKQNINNALTVVLNSDCDVPADDIELTVPYSPSLCLARRIFAYNGDELVFEGTVDEILTAASRGRAVTKLAARSCAGALLDNEAPPVTYVNPAAELIFERHLKPFGVKSFDGAPEPFYGSLRIEKGMTHWQVLESFCRNRFDSVPRISGDGRAFMNGFGGGDTVTFGAQGIVYGSLREDRLPCRLIGEIRLRLSEYGDYGGTLRNRNPECRDVRRTRFLNAVSDKTTVKTADKIIENSNKNSYSLILECIGCRLGIMGRSAVVRDSLLGDLSGLRVEGLRYSLDRDGEVTSVMLRKENF